MIIPYEDLITVLLVASAFLAVHMDDTTHSVISFGFMFAVLSTLYFALGAYFAAVFQIVVAVGTIAVFFLAGEMLTSKRRTKGGRVRKPLEFTAAVLLSIPALISKFEFNTLMKPQGLSFQRALWEFRALDVVAQGVVVLTLALGVVMVLRERRRVERGRVG